METIESFATRVLARTGLTLCLLPDGEPEDMLGGSIACRSPHGTVVLVDHIEQDEDGCDIYARAVVVERGPFLPPADPTATGLLGDFDPVVRRSADAHDLYTVRGIEAPEWIALGQFSGSASSVSEREAARRNAATYTPVTTLRQRGPVDATESIDAPEGLSVDFDAVISSTVDEGRTDPSVGVDVVTRYRARVGDAEAIFERRSWRPGWGYSASGDEDRVIVSARPAA